MALEILESEIYGTQLKYTDITQAPFPTVGPFSHSFKKLSWSRHSDLAMKDKTRPSPRVQNPALFVL